MFIPEINYDDDKDSLSHHLNRYSIIFYKLNQGNNPIPVKEYSFPGYPVNEMFYISHCGKYLYFFQQNVSSNNKSSFCQANVCVILDINTLTETRIIKLESKQTITVTESALFQNTKYLYIRTVENEHLFYSVEEGKLIWSIGFWYTYISLLIENSGNEQDNTFETNWCLYQACFREKDEGFIFFYSFKEEQKRSNKYIFRIKIGQELNQIFKDT